jgi:hypothetical protein
VADQGHLFDFGGPLAAELLEKPREPAAVLGDVEAGVVAEVERAEVEIVTKLLPVGARPWALGVRVGLRADPPRFLCLAEAVDEDREPGGRVFERLLESLTAVRSSAPPEMLPAAEIAAPAPLPPSLSAP